MRRLMVLAGACCCVLTFGPATALARHHHKRHHSRHHALRRTERFGSVTASGTMTTPSSPSQTAGTVTSFSGGVLTITLNNGNAVSGTVAGDTEIECQGMENEGAENEAAENEGAENDAVENDLARDDGPGDGGGDSGGSQTSGGDDNQGDDDNEQECSSAMLTPGAVVDGAELTISSAGATWAKIELG